MSGRYKIYADLNFGVSKLDSGVRSFDELYKLAKDMREDVNFSKIYFQLTDMRGCLFDFDRSRLVSMAELIEAHQIKDNQHLGVYMIDKPIETAYIHLFLNSIRYKRELCSTPEKAYCLSQLPVNYLEFLNLIDI